MHGFTLHRLLGGHGRGKVFRDEVDTFNSFISSLVVFFFFFFFFFINPQFVKAKLRRRGEIHFRLQTWKGKLHCHFSKDTRKGVLNFMCGQKGRTVTGASWTDSYICRILKEMYPCDYFDPTWGLWTKPFPNFHGMALECIFVLGLPPKWLQFQISVIQSWGTDKIWRGVVPCRGHHIWKWWRCADKTPKVGVFRWQTK